MALKPTIPRGNRSRVYGRMVDLLQTDKYLSTIFPKNRWAVSRGEPFDPSALGQEPFIYLAPRPYSAAWYGPDSMVSMLQVDVYMWLPGNNEGLYNAFDALDVWEIVEQVFYPLNDRTKQQSIWKSLKDLGATTGIVFFSQPATQQQTGDSGLVSYGQLQIEVKRLISP